MPSPSSRHTTALPRIIAAALLAACGGPPPRTANPSRLLDEPRALQIITETFREEQENPVDGTDIALSAMHRLHVDVLAEGKRFGVAYVTASERAALGPALPARNPSMGDALQLVSGVGSDSDARVCVLYDSDYFYDYRAGELREQTAIAAELKLRRDVRDFLEIAHREHLR
jgi:hypothetical protein